MKNKCKHKNKVFLLHAGIRGIKVEWCKECGATRYHEISSWQPIEEWRAGKWKSPDIARK